jgi:hypothetical protein
MGEAAESGDDLAMMPRVTIVAAPQLDQKIVVAEQFAMHQRHVEEILLCGAQRAVKAFFNTFLGQSYGLRIGNKCPCGIAKHVARELVEHDDQCSQGLRGIAPLIQVSRARRFVCGQETLANIGVQLIVVGIPARALYRGEPVR